MYDYLFSSITFKILKLCATIYFYDKLTEIKKNPEENFGAKYLEFRSNRTPFTSSLFLEEISITRSVETTFSTNNITIRKIHC